MYGIFGTLSLNTYIRAARLAKNTATILGELFHSQHINSRRPSGKAITQTEEEGLEDEYYFP